MTANNATNLLEAFNDAVHAISPGTDTATDMLTATNHLVDALTALKVSVDATVPASKLADDILKLLVFTGVDASGAAADATLTGAKVGDVVVGVVNLTDAAIATTSFSGTISTLNKIHQLSTDLSAKTLFVLLIAKGS